MITQAPNYRRRKLADQLMRGLTIGATLLALVPLFLILGYVLVRGASALNLAFFTQAYEPPVVELNGAVGNAGGVLHGIIGSLMIVGIALLMALPIGILAAVFLSEYPSNSIATVVRFCTDVLSAAPSIVIGVVAYVLIVQRTHQFSALAGSVALAVLMIPVITRTTEEILKLVPSTMREAAVALGAPKWWLTLTVILPTALSGIVTGVLLAFARATGETAPLLLTVLGNNNVSFKLLEPMAALPLLTYKYTDTPFPAQNTLAWGTALVLTLLVLTVNITVRWATRRRMK
ncbi:MAG TPA: phosphate ABC transporter permease PstA [Kouleothrix sp.]|uniref:phosphate ABC transporter permease PstA n=1 Tax=Kouleothrix sp. TaxID=2779161 RepID=UPI002BF4B5FB|nr:phosphate ABC transporter permease PstA [Kouleothrix sp.]HRC74980.1 phosphate ABC transporter permease PstA [Kouleothrix sp.]